MNVTYVDQYFKTREMVGGTRGYEMMKRLAMLGHSITVVTTDRAPSAQAGWRVSKVDDIEVHWIDIPYGNEMSFTKRVLSFFRFAVRAAGKVGQIESDVIFATSTPLTIALPAAYGKRRQRSPMVLEVRDLWPELPIAIGALKNPAAVAAARWLERFAYRNADRVVALSPGMKDGVVATGYPEDRVDVIPNSSDIDLFRVPSESGTKWRSDHPEIGNRPMVLYAGTLGPINGVDWLARVALAASEINSLVCFVVVGGGREMGRVRAAAEDLGVLGRNFFMYPALPKIEMPAVLSAATICTSLFLDIESMWHNSANKFFDAFAAARPVALNYGGWQADLVRQHDAGIVLPPSDVQCAARELVERVYDLEWLKRAGAVAGRLAYDHFDRDKLASRLEIALSKAASQPPRV